jgi:hypothetical protein
MCYYRIVDTSDVIETGGKGDSMHVYMAEMKSGGLILEARGCLKGRVYYVRKGTLCARARVIPGNPRTKRQQAGRGRFAESVRRWQGLDREGRDHWNERARGLNMSGYNLFISHQMKQGEVAEASACHNKAACWRGKKMMSVKRNYKGMIRRVIRVYACRTGAFPYPAVETCTLSAVPGILAGHYNGSYNMYYNRI